MKIAASSGKPSRKVDLIIPLADDEAHHKLTKENSVTWEPRTRPTQNDSPTYKMQVRILSGSETVPQMLRWRKDLDKVCKGLNATDLASMKPIMVACMRPRVETLFEATLVARAEAAYNEQLEAALVVDQTAANTNASDAVRANGVDHYRHVDHLKTALNEALLGLMPAKVCSKVKRQMRREMRKPLDMKVREYCQNLLRLNTDDIPHLPPHKNNQALSSDELLDILLWGTPRSWQNEMDRQGFDPIEKGLYSTVDFMENLEGLEEKSLAQESSSDKKSKDKPKSKAKSNEGSKKKASHYCSHHGPNYTHNTEDCRVLKNKDKDGKFSNKTWTRKSEDSTSKSKKELAAFLKKQVKEGVKKELAAIQKKRKSDESDDEEGECLLLDMLESKLDGFNYADMDKMSISEDKTSNDEISDEVSV